MFNNQIIAGAAGQGGSFYPYSIDQSLRFNDDDGAYLSRAYSTTQTNNKLITVSVWFKLGNLKSTSGRAVILHARNGGAGEIRLQSDKLQANCFDTGYVGFRSEGLFRDTAAWYHIVYQGDSTNATASARNRVWLNGQELTNAATSFPPQNTVLNVLKTGQTTMVGRNVDNAAHDWDGYLAEMHVIDGSLVDVSNFGETINGVWVPKAYSGGSYGTNGFYLPFDDSSAIGDDESGNTNDFTANNLVASDVVPDSPTNNFATLNSAANFMPATLAEGNLKATPTSSSDKRYHSTFPISSGKWYCEIRIVSTGNRNHIGFWGTENTASTSVPTNYARLGVGNSSSATSGTFNGTAFTASAGDILTYAFDADDGKLYFGRNAAPTIGATADFTGLASDTYVLGQRETGTLGTTNHFNFGQDSTFAGAISAGGNADGNGFGDFKYSVPSGFLAMCSANLPEPTIGPNSAEQADDYFNTVLWSGDNTASRAITGIGHAPDFVWIKTRNQANEHSLFDSVRGVAKDLESNSTAVEQANNQWGFVNSFDSDGFTVVKGSQPSPVLVNSSGNTFVAWNWKAGGTAVSNTDGSITSQVSAAPDAGFSICTWTGNGTSGATIGHGLSSAPELIFSKRRDSSGMWTTYAKPAASDAETDYLRLDGTDALADDSRIWNDTVPTASVFSVGSGTSHINTNNATHVTYCFHSVPGYSLVSSYVGNGSADGTFVYTGFRPRWLLIKETGNANSWEIYDTARDPDNVASQRLFPNDSAAEATTNPSLDMLSNGFKARAGNTGINRSGGNYIYLAFAEAPFKYANAR